MMLDLDIIDAHHHLTDLTRSYPWLEGPAEPFRYHGDDRPLRRSYLPDDYRRDFGELRLVGSVHVENGAADPLAEVVWIDELSTSRGLPTVQVAKVSLQSASAPSDIEKLADYPTSSFAVSQGPRTSKKRISESESEMGFSTLN